MKKALLAAIAIVSMGVASIETASAAPPQRYEQSQDNQRTDRNDRNDRDDQFKRGSYVVNGHRYERVSGPAWKAPRGYHQQNWQRGQRLPVEYRKVVVRDYRSAHLNAPPRGYEYVRVGNDVVLTAIATGVISAVIANAFFN